MAPYSNILLFSLDNVDTPNCYVFHNRAHYWPCLFVFNLLMFSLPPKPYGQFATAQTTLCRIGLSPPSFHIFLAVIFVTEWVSDFSDVTLVSEDTYEDKSYQVKKLSSDQRSEGWWRFNVFLLETMPNNVQMVISFPFFTRLAFATLPRNSLPLRILKSTKSTYLLFLISCGIETTDLLLDQNIKIRCNPP